MHRTIDDVARHTASLFGSIRSTATAVRRRKDPRVIVLAVATFAVVAGVVVGLVARWPLEGVVLSFLLTATLAAVYATSGPPAFRGGEIRAFSATFRRRTGGRTADESAARSESEAGDVSAERLLQEAGLLADDAGVRNAAAYEAAVRGHDAAELPRIARDFESEWRRRIVDMDGRDGDAAALASLLRVPEEDVELEWDPEGPALVASVRGQRAGNWPSRAAFVADVTAVAEFRSAFPKWWSLSPAMRTRVLAALRLCLDWCPACDGSLSIDRRPSRTGDADRQRPTGRRDSLGDADETRRVSSAPQTASDDVAERSSASSRASPDGATVLALTCQACGADVFAAELDDGKIDPRTAPADADVEL
ncbi:hypothetical protein [Halopelagius fulvigenes]|uniref:DUF8054 domain-containing protein n=1 Tax=Halopelagius fulvigenes TaxID=1198324 RepID=A0ABD5U289_9EURY